MILLERELSSLAKIGDGAHASLKRINKGIPYLTAKNISKSGIDYKNINYISEETYNKYFKDTSNALTQPKKDDILYSIIGSIGAVYVVRDEQIGISSSVAILRADKSKILPEYLAYYMNGPVFDTNIQAVRGGVAQGFMSLAKLGSIIIKYPKDITYQKKIVDILSTYDNLIENNQKQIKLLEEAAQRLYKEWFVDLRFPGYENVEIVDGVPEGWQYKKVSSFGSVITGKTPSTAKSQYYGGEVPFIKIPDMHKGIFPLVTEVTLSLEGANSQKNKFIPKNSIMVSCIATVGLVNISIEDCQTNQQINSIVLADERSLYYLYFAMKDLKSLLDGVGSNGATMTNVNKEKFSNLSILWPDTLLLEKYYEYSKPLFDKILNLSKNINYLTEARDRILPKLMSGEIEV